MHMPFLPGSVDAPIIPGPAYYRQGPGKDAPDAELRAESAAKVHFNIESTLNSRTDADPAGNVFAERTAGPGAFATALGRAITGNGLEDRADGTNLQARTAGGASPWLAGLRWPDRETRRANPFRARTGDRQGPAGRPAGDRRPVHDHRGRGRTRPGPT
jgi:glycerophosphoryl diester phosphodiesterase